jgi:protein-L-isoaspartate(D-aspartate) O-methyltransferase
MTISKRTFLTGAIGLWLGDCAGATDEHEQARSRLLAEIQSDLRDTASTTGRRQFDPAVLAAIANVPRHRFVPPQMAALAYSNRPLAIGHGQTISQPFIVALMTQLIDPKPTDRVLEIGTGSGYQAAVLAKLVARVYTIEIVRPLGERAAELLRELGYANAPFDVIVVTAAPDRMPQPLIDQLAPGGRLIAPIGPQGGTQNLLLMRKDLDGSTVTRNVLPVRFVPLTRIQ